MGITKLKIDLGAVIQNYNYYKSLVKPQTKIMVVSKASAYGNGELEIVKLLASKNADYLAVALAQEGVFFRENGIKTKILIFLTDQQDFDLIVDNQLEPSVFDPHILQAFLDFLKHREIENYPIHIKIDTGMNRLGFKGDDIEIALGTSSEKRVKVISVFSHLLASDDPDKDHISQRQITLFDSIIAKFKKRFQYDILFHILNTRGISRFTDSQLDMVRLGIGLYGYSGLKEEYPITVSSLYAEIIGLKTVLSGEYIGYGGDHPLTEDRDIAILSIGYADGLSRLMGHGRGFASLHGVRCPYIGSICMDISMIDVTDIHCKVGDDVQIFGSEIPIEEVADVSQTIPYEIFTSISKRVKRTYINE